MVFATKYCTVLYIERDRGKGTGGQGEGDQGTGGQGARTHLERCEGISHAASLEWTFLESLESFLRVHHEG